MYSNDRLEREGQAVIAQIVLNSVSKATDNIYHYLVPKRLEDKVKIGMRVFVPFGRSNKKTEAFVLGFADEPDTQDLKEISDTADSYSYFDENMSELVRFMKHRYFCTYISAVRAVIPSGVGIQTRKIVTAVKELGDSAKKYLEHSLRASEIYNLLADGSKTADEITSAVGGKSISPVLNTMEKKGVITISREEHEGVKDSVEVRVRLAVSYAEAIRAVEAMQRRAPARARCLEIISENRDMALGELLEYAAAGRSVVKVLCEKGYVSMYETVRRESLFDDVREVSSSGHVLTDEQRAVSDRVFDSIKRGEKQTFLLRGVTGSGKTEVYLDLIKKTVSLGKQAVFLVPEISLTPQMVNQVISRFGERVAVFHSSLTRKQRYEQWKSIKDGDADIVVGARSAVFAPFKNPGLFIIDEEHENTYKSELSPKYSAVEIARFRARQNSAVVLLASATPLVESTYRAQSGKYIPLEMTKRISKSGLPRTEIVDMRAEMAEGNMSIFSRRLAELMGENLESGMQTILFLNRRGFSSFVSCRECGYVVQCPNCNVSLTYHKAVNKMVCHYCDYVTDVPLSCPSCSGKYIKYFGVGTQRVADEIEKLFPKASVIRMDADTTARRMSHETLLSRFRNREADILVGTQMITKGLDFENVTLVGIVAADMSLNMDDYRAAERTFDLITQVTGRAGRGAHKGRAVIQTYNPENETILSAAKQDYEEFYRDEIELRKLLIYPPFCEFLNFVFTSEDRKKAHGTAKSFYEELKSLADSSEILLYPVGEAPMFRINNKYRYRFLAKSRYSRNLYDTIQSIYKKYVSLKGSPQITIDVNPSNMY